MTCTRCNQTGFLNFEQLPPDVQQKDNADILKWCRTNENHDVTVCDCCGDGHSHWHGTAGEHDQRDYGEKGPYAYNGGLPECH